MAKEFYFIGQGKFPAAGSYVVRIPGSGSPQAEGDARFTVFFDSSFCMLDVSVIAGGSSGGTAAFALEGAGP